MSVTVDRPRTAVVAGGTGALGSAVTSLLLSRGEKVCVPWLAQAEAQRLADAHPDAVADGRLRLSQCDVADGDQVAALLDVLRADWGPLWLACSTVGGWVAGTPVEQMRDFSVLDRMLMLNLRTATVMAAEGLRHMGDSGGRVVLVASQAARTTPPGQAAYSAAKAGVVSLVSTLAVELRGTNRTANAVVPDILDTPENRRSMPNSDPDRWLPPAAVAQVIAWLASDAAWPVNGAAVPLSAG